MVPIIELRLAIPIAYGLGGLEAWQIFIAAVLGNMLPVPFILKLIVKIFDWMKTKEGFLGKVANKMIEIAEKRHDKVDKYGWIGLWLLVAIPLPGTGAWTGSLVAGVFRMSFKKALLAVFAGVVTAGIIMLFGSQLVVWISGMF